MRQQEQREIPVMTLPHKTWWHELNTWEPEVALAFYGRTLGWQFEEAALPDGAPYWIARQDGRPVGGIFGLTAPDYDGIPSHWMTYMTVPDIDEAASATTRAGGEVMRPAAEVPGVGRLAVVSDSTGALIGLIEPSFQHVASSYH
jgi:predicted enzyme related to lactoylglutathione lyase